MTRRREWISQEIVRCCDTVALLTCDEVTDIRRRADAGEFDEMQFTTSLGDIANAQAGAKPATIEVIDALPPSQTQEA
jgi:hypothetical protein